MELPQYADYQRAVQHPDLAFKHDPDLRICHTETLLGSPWARTGNFAYTYRLEGGGKAWAVRCFSKYVPGQRRYEVISRFVRAHPSQFFVPTDYLQEGIRINGRWYPITKSLWVEGDTLEVFVERHLSDHGAISSLLAQFQSLVGAMERLEVAHGDLQHGNVMVSGGKLVLIDYDGMYVPELASSESHERGHPNYQHPARNQEFGPYLDRFSSIVIYLALKAITQAPDLWDKYSAGGERLLFRQKDFLAPADSRLLADLEDIPALRPLIPGFRRVCKTDLAQVPRLADFLSGRMVTVLPESAVVATRWQQYEIVSAEQRNRLLEFVGQRVTVVGKIADFHSSRTKYDKPYVFLGFGDWRRGDFRLVIWSEALELFRARGKDLQNYRGKWVSVTGLLTEYQKGNWPKHPQIVVGTPAEIEVLAGGKEQAKRRLSGQTSSRPRFSKASPVISETPPGKPRQPSPPTVSEARQELAPDASEIDSQIPSTRPSQADLRLAERYFKRGLKFRKRGAFDKAIREYQAALRLNPDYAEVHNNLGWIHSRQGRLDEAIDAYGAALRIAPEYGLAHRNLGWTYRQKGRLDKAIQAFESALRTDPEDKDAHFGLGLTYEDQGRWDEAIHEYQAALRINPRLDRAHNNLGRVYAKMGRFDEAIGEFQAALQLNWASRSTHRNLGIVYRRLGRMAEARRELKIAARLGSRRAREMLREMD